MLNIHVKLFPLYIRNSSHTQKKLDPNIKKKLKVIAITGSPSRPLTRRPAPDDIREAGASWRLLNRRMRVWRMRVRSMSDERRPRLLS